MVSPRLITTGIVTAVGGDSHAASVVRSVTAIAAQSANPRARTKSPSRITTPYSAQTVTPGGSSRSTTKMARVRLIARPMRRLSAGGNLPWQKFAFH